MSYEQSTHEEETQAPPQTESKQSDKTTTHQPGVESETAQTPPGMVPSDERPDPESVSVADLFPTTELGIDPMMVPLEEDELPEITQEVIESPGEVIDASTQTALEQSGTHGLGNVYVHNDTNAAKAAEELDAHAVVVDNHIICNHTLEESDSSAEEFAVAYGLTAIEQGDNGVSILPKDAELPDIGKTQESE